MRDWRGSGSSPGLHNRWGTKTTRGHMLNTTLGVCCNRGDKHEVGAQILNGGAGHNWPSTLATALAWVPTLHEAVYSVVGRRNC